VGNAIGREKFLECGDLSPLLSNPYDDSMKLAGLRFVPLCCIELLKSGDRSPHSILFEVDLNCVRGCSVDRQYHINGASSLKSLRRGEHDVDLIQARERTLRIREGHRETDPTNRRRHTGQGRAAPDTRSEKH
jgi:hypothetical protein